MRLVISEKNIAAKRIAEILAVGKPTTEKVYTTPAYLFRRDGEDWVSIGLKGHIMGVDFPEEFEEVVLKKWLLASLPTLVKAPVLKLPSEKGIIQSIKSLAKKADDVIIATDFDREGELIGADARDIVRGSNKTVPVSRVRFSAITKDEIERAFAEPGEISECLAQAGEARQDIDLIWGATLTRYLTLAHQTKTRKPFGDVLSAGRVQTPTLKLIVDREAERDRFVPEDYWTVKGAFESGGDEFTAGHATDRFKTEDAATKALEAVAGASTGTVVETKKTRRKVDPPVPFNTTSLMAAAANEGLSPARTMQVAESLYMSGFISYPRVDNTVYPPSLDLKAILNTLAEVPVYREHAKRILSGPLTPTRGPKETTDHPPIHPTGAGDPEKLDGQAWKIYNLVSRRFMATLMPAAFIEATRVDIDVAGERFAAKGDIVVTPGFRAVYTYGLKKDEVLPAMSEGDIVAFRGATLDAKQTQPPARYSSGKLIQEMERLGLGTKATRHDIIQTLADRKYVTGEPIEPTCKGITVVTALAKYAERITTPEMTSELEAEMDAIADAKAERIQVVDHSRQLLADIVATLLPLADEVGETLKTATDEDAKVGVCPISGHDLLIKFSPKTKSYFVGCQGYPDCAQTYPLPKNAKFEAVAEMCEVCGAPQVKVIKFKTKPRIMCLAPDCPTKKGPEITVGKCPSCGGALQVKYSQVGTRYIRCENYEAKEHSISYPLPQVGEIEPTEEICDPCGAPKVIVHTKKGPWKICVDPACPNKPPSKSKWGAKKAAVKKPAAAKKPAAKKAVAKKPAAKKAGATKTGTKKTTAKKDTGSESATE
ncbi:MAG: DNA topoisomerase I [Coriobacteriia bacterium]|nr:DNA topoisomerase I [Coriobacteriia bacterium]